MKKIIFGITSLGLGGAERVLVDIVNKLNKDYDITIFTLYSKGEFEKKISSNVKIISLYDKTYNDMTKLQKIGVSLRLLFKGNSVYEKNIKAGKYDSEIAFLEGPITRLFATKNPDTKKIAWVHSDISQIFGNSIKAKLKKKYDKKVYTKYDNIVFVSNDNLEKFKKVYSNIDENKLKLVYNYIDADNVINSSNEKMDIEFEKEKLNIVTVARLTEAKAIDRLIRVHTNLIKNGFNHNIYVVGDGPQKEELQHAIVQSDVKDTFKLLGAKENPYPYIKNADYFCLLSYFEGYPMVLEEAKILDKFIITTNNASREVIKNYPNSIILENNEEAVYEGLKDIIKNTEKYKNKIVTKEKYDNSVVLEKVKEVL